MNEKMEVLVVKPPKDDGQDEYYTDVIRTNCPARFLTFLVRNKRNAEDQIFKAFPVDSVYRRRCGWLIVECKHPRFASWKIRGIVRSHTASF